MTIFFLGFMIALCLSLSWLIHNTEENEKFWLIHNHKNFPLTWKGRTIWRSRAVAVVGFIFAKDKDGDYYVLANKRGKGTPDFQGFWNAPCGYLDFNETTEEAVAREVLEETHIKVNPKKLIFEGFDSSPFSNQQNVTIRYLVLLDKTIEENSDFSTENAEKDEVDNIKWVNVKNLGDYKWAFNHNSLIDEAYDRLLKIVFEHENFL